MGNIIPFLGIGTAMIATLSFVGCLICMAVDMSYSAWTGQGWYKTMFAELGIRLWSTFLVSAVILVIMLITAEIWQKIKGEEDGIT